MSLATHPDRSHRRLESSPAESDNATVAAVDRLIEGTLATLREHWTDLAAGVVPRPGVLHTDSVLELLAGLAMSGGKHLRPRMVHWGWVAASGRVSGGYEDLVRAGAALELLHVFALIHDDVMDQSETRRGRPSVHAEARRQHLRLRGLGDSERYGENIAILAGDLAHSEADALVAGLPERMQQLWRTLSTELMIRPGALRHCGWGGVRAARRHPRGGRGRQGHRQTRG